MEVIVIILFTYLEAYSIFLFLYILIKLIKKKKLPTILLIANFFIIAGFFFIRQKVNEGEFVLVGSYDKPSDSWEEGLANVMISLYNHGIVFFCFSITQLLFWIFFLKRYKSLNNQGIKLSF